MVVVSDSAFESVPHLVHKSRRFLGFRVMDHGSWIMKRGTNSSINKLFLYININQREVCLCQCARSNQHFAPMEWIKPAGSTPRCFHSSIWSPDVPLRSARKWIRALGSGMLRSRMIEDRREVGGRGGRIRPSGI